MKIYSIVFLVLLYSNCFSQTNSIVGKWKPVHFNLGNMVEGDMSKNNPNVLISMDSLVKNDKDPVESKEMMEMIFQLMFDKTKNTIEEYYTDGTFTDTDVNKGRTKKGTYAFDAKSNNLIKTYTISDTKLNFKVSITDNKLVITSKLKQIGEKESEYTVTYKKL